MGHEGQSSELIAEVGLPKGHSSESVSPCALSEFFEVVPIPGGESHDVLAFFVPELKALWI